MSADYYGPVKVTLAVGATGMFPCVGLEALGIGGPFPWIGAVVSLAAAFIAGCRSWPVVQPASPPDLEGEDDDDAPAALGFVRHDRPDEALTLGSVPAGQPAEKWTARDDLAYMDAVIRAYGPDYGSGAAA